MPSSACREAVCVRGRDGTSRGCQSWADAWAENRKSREQGCMSVSSAGALLAARHDLEVLQGTASSLTTSCLPGGCRAMTHGDRLGGQLHQALAEPAQAQLLWRPRERRRQCWVARQHRGWGVGSMLPSCPLPTPYTHVYLLWSSPHHPPALQLAIPISR